MAALPEDYQPEFEPGADPDLFGRFEKSVPSDLPGVTATSVLQGWLVAKPKGSRAQWIVQEGHNVPTPVPPGYKRKPVTAAWLRELHVPVDERPLIARGTVSVDAFLVLAKPFFLRKRDVLRWLGRELAVVSLDRNWGDVAMTVRARGAVAPTAAFFEDNVARVTFLAGGSRMRLQSAWQEEPDELDVEVAFEPEGGCVTWYPLRDGTLPAQDPQGLLPLLGRPVHWKNFTKDTLVGFRDPMLLTRHLTVLPKLVYWT